MVNKEIKGDNIKFLDTKENGNRKPPNLGDKAKAIVKEKLIIIQGYLKNKRHFKETI